METDLVVMFLEKINKRLKLMPFSVRFSPGFRRRIAERVSFRNLVPTYCALLKASLLSPMVSPDGNASRPSSPAATRRKSSQCF